MNDKTQKSVDQWKNILDSVTDKTPEQKRLHDSFRKQFAATEAKLKEKQS